MNQPDRQLIALCLRGHQPAMSTLHHAYAPGVAAYFLRSGFIPADAEDLTQEVFVRAFKSLSTFDAARGSFRTWVAAIARNTARKYWKKRSNHEEHYDPELAEEVLPDGRLGAPTMEAVEEIDALRDCILELPDALATVVHMRYVEGLTTRGIAAVTGYPEATVRLRLSEAAKLLAQCLKKKGFT